MSTARLNYVLLRHHPQSVQALSSSLDTSPREQHPAFLSASEINPRALMPACWTHLCFLPDSLKLEWLSLIRADALGIAA